MSLSNLTIKKGIELFEPTESKDLLQKARLFANSGLIDHTLLKRNIQAIVDNRGDYLSGNWTSVIDNLLKLLGAQKIEILNTQTKWLPISLCHVYCPEVEHSKVKIECANSKSFIGDTNIEILGIGGGANFNIEFTSALEIEAQSKSFAIVYEFESVWEHIKLTEVDGTIKEFCRLKSINENHRRATTLDLNNSLEIQEDQIDQVEEIILKKGVKGVKKMSIKSGRQLKTSSKLKLETFGLEVGTEMIVANQFDINCEYTLPGGYTYKAIHPRNAAYWFWIVVS